MGGPGDEEGDEGDEDREHFREGDEGDEGDEDRERFREGDEGGEGDEGDEDGEPFREGNEGGEGDEGHEVSWSPSGPRCVLRLRRVVVSTRSSSVDRTVHPSGP